MAQKSDVEVLAEQVSAIATGVTATSAAVVQVANQIRAERARSNAISAATFEALSRRERPVFVAKLREQGFTQAEVGEAIGRSQSAVHQYEKKFNQQNPKEEK